ncbi:MAG: helix-turn-helix domain-containing protein [Heliobacteriaceae bacterium]|jgi:transcriptional regulator with XRE-family HTH domain|nr:helix-turn-helix domain-containing protein [Heliobacteriaceae bacterium]
MNIKQLLGARIRDIRRKKNFSQEHFSELIDMNPRQIVRIENGESFPTAEHLEKIAKALDVTVQELFHNEFHLPVETIRAKILDKLHNLNTEQLRTVFTVVMDL